MSEKIKAEFRTELVALCINDTYWKIYLPLHFYSKILDKVIIVPENFYTDFASIRRIPVVYLLLANIAKKAATIHDYLYRKDAIPELDRETADRVFLEAMKASKVSYLRRKILYYGVRMFASLAYHEKYVKDIIE